jgi:hypothetical protein
MPQAIRLEESYMLSGNQRVHLVVTARYFVHFFQFSASQKRISTCWKLRWLDEAGSMRVSSAWPLQRDPSEAILVSRVVTACWDLFFFVADEQRRTCRFYGSQFVGLREQSTCFDQPADGKNRGVVQHPFSQKGAYPTGEKSRHEMI